jgi:hypothetical protein
MYEPKTLTLTSDIKTGQALIDVKNAALDFGCSRVIGTCKGHPFELDLSDELVKRGLN